MPQGLNTVTLLLAVASLSQAHDIVSSATMLLPHATEGLWASVITEAASSTEYFVACSSAWDSPQDCDAPFTGVTLTAKSSGEIDLELGATHYHCSLGDDGTDAFCRTKANTDSSDDTLVIAGSETADWLATLGVVEPTQVIELRDNVQRSPQGDGGGSSGGGGGGGGGGGW